MQPARPKRLKGTEATRRPTKVVLALGNPGPRYDATRHNVAWWVADRLAYDWGFPLFEEGDTAFASQAEVAGIDVEIRKPTVFMNRSGLAITDLAHADNFDLSRDLLVIVDDASLDVGRVRFRPSGGTGGHNGLRSIEAVVESDQYPRLRLGVGRCPDGVDLADWVLSAMDPSDEDAFVEMLPELTPAVELWMLEGTEAAMNRFNR